MSFWNKKTDPISDPKLIERISALESRQTHLAAEILDLNLSLGLLRDKVLKKIKGKFDQEDLEEPKDLKKQILLPER